MSKQFFYLLLGPWGLGILLSVSPAFASEAARTIEFAAPLTLELSISRDETVDVPMLDITLEESDTAIALYGCDCAAHINALRELRGQAPIRTLIDSLHQSL